MLGASAAVNVVLNFVLIPDMGIRGAAGSLVAYALLGISTLLVSRRYLKFNLNPLFLLKSTAAAAVMALCVWLIDPQSTTWMLASIVIGVVIYFGVLLALRGLSRGEIKFFVNLLAGSLNRIRGNI